jgi:acetoin utilization protein AcuB
VQKREVKPSLPARASVFIRKEVLAMIVKEIMTTKLVIVAPDDTLSHAANLLRQHQFHHLPVARMSEKSYRWFPGEIFDTQKHTRDTLPVLEGLVTSEDIDIAVAISDEHPDDAHYPRWQDRRVVEVMHSIPLIVTPTTNAAFAARILVERNLNCLPIVEFSDGEETEQQPEGGQKARPLLIGLLTRSDLLMAMSRAFSSTEPGIEILIPLPAGNMRPLADMLKLATELHIQVHNVIAAPLEGNVPQRAIVHIGTIYPAPLLVRLRAANIQYEFADVPPEVDAHA